MAHQFCRLPFRVWPILLIGLSSTLACNDRPTIEDVESPVSLMQKKKGFIAFVGAAEQDPLWPILRHGAEQYAEEFESMRVQYYLPQGNSPRHQVELLQTLNDPHMYGVCIHINDAESVRPRLEQLRTQGVLIVSMIVPARPGIAVGHVGFNDHRIGEALAEATAQALNRKGTIMMLHAGTDDTRYASRLAGFRNGIRKHPEIEIFASNDCQQDPLEARRIIRSKSERFPRLSAWITLDDWPLRQLGREERPLPRGMRLITFGGLPGHWSLIRNGTCTSVVAINYNNIGTRAAEICDAAIRELPRFPQVYQAPSRIVTLANLDEYIRDWGYWSTGRFSEDPFLAGTPD